ncbi:nuclear transport factor 2 family protein [Streptomyces sp. CA-251387]|uniref:nuclear transport factor 2 family protein n=1 Tax=Streptomyces sp. CA-251387 TaxID=3240064 RepID=UPI003D8D68FD
MLNRKREEVPDGIEIELRKLFEAWMTSIKERDVSFVDRVMAPEFRYTHFTGETFDLAGYRCLYEALAEDGGTDIHGIENFCVQLLADGAVALVTGEFLGDHTYSDGRTEHEDVRFLCIWEKCAGEWRAVALQAVGKQLAAPSG